MRISVEGDPLVVYIDPLYSFCLPSGRLERLGLVSSILVAPARILRSRIVVVFRSTARPYLRIHSTGKREMKIRFYREIQTKFKGNFKIKFEELSPSKKLNGNATFFTSEHWSNTGIVYG